MKVSSGKTEWFLILLGAPGGGKGTQAAFLSRKFGIPQIATGDLFRQAVEEGTELGLVAKSYMDKGALVPDDVTIKMVLERVNDSNCESGCIFDGFPRTLEQAEALDKALAAIGKAIDKAIYIQVPEKTLINALADVGYVVNVRPHIMRLLHLQELPGYVINAVVGYISVPMILKRLSRKG